LCVNVDMRRLQNRFYNEAMRPRYYFIFSAALFVAAVVTIASKWNGTFTVGAGSAASAWHINFCGSETGWPAAAGIVVVLLAVIVFIIALIRSATGLARHQPRAE